jgi:hypothetical protein
MAMRRAALSALLLTLAACSAGPAPQGADTAPADGGEQVAGAALVPSATSSSSDACKTRRLGVRVSRRGTAPGGAVRAVLIFTNTGANACALTGWPTIALDDGGHERKPVATTVAEPTSPVDVVLQPGVSAFAGLRWTPCDADSPGCAAGGRLLAAAPGSDLVEAELSDFSLALRKQITIRSIVIGSIQPTTTGITSW